MLCGLQIARRAAMLANVVDCALEIPLTKAKKWKWHMVYVRRLTVFGLTAMAMFSAWAANAQCYQFSAIAAKGGKGGPVSLTLDLKNLPHPTVSGVPGSTDVTYFWYSHAGATVPLPGASVSLIDAGTSYPAKLTQLYIVLSVSRVTTFKAVLHYSLAGYSNLASTITLSGPGNLLPNGALPLDLPPISAWTSNASFGSLPNLFTVTSISRCPG